MRTCTDCGRPHRARGYCGSCYNRHFAKPSQALTPCTVCGTMVMKDKRDHAKRRPVCSEMCKAFLTHGHWPICELGNCRHCRRRASAIAKIEWAMVQPPTWQRWYAGQCKRCRAWFVHNMPHTNWCSERCQRAGNHARRDARERGAFVEHVPPLEIFQRDGWRCGICHRLTLRTRTVPHPKAPVLDHIIPLAAGVEAGGVHSRANVQCAHFMCNSIKQANAANDQLLLFG